jgi:hypothetical protein
VVQVEALLAVGTQLLVHRHQRLLGEGLSVPSRELEGDVQVLPARLALWRVEANGAERPLRDANVMLRDGATDPSRATLTIAADGCRVTTLCWCRVTTQLSKLAKTGPLPIRVSS